jgi:hypothetical protein
VTEGVAPEVDAGDEPTRCDAHAPAVVTMSNPTTAVRILTA